jgi:hypothetical protein
LRCFQRRLLAVQEFSSRQIIPLRVQRTRRHHRERGEEGEREKPFWEHGLSEKPNGSQKCPECLNWDVWDAWDYLDEECSDGN